MTITATVKQAIEIIKMQAFRAPQSHIADYLAESRIDDVVAYHVTKHTNADAIRVNGIKATDCYNRNPAVYIFLDRRDVRDNGENITGEAEFTVFTVRIPAEVAASIKDDGLYNGTFSTSYSACRLETHIPSSWIIDEAIETDSHR